jgi:hypothetical protein
MINITPSIFIVALAVTQLFDRQIIIAIAGIPHGRLGDPPLSLRWVFSEGLGADVAASLFPLKSE